MKVLHDRIHLLPLRYDLNKIGHFILYLSKVEEP